MRACMFIVRVVCVSMVATRKVVFVSGCVVCVCVVNLRVVSVCVCVCVCVITFLPVSSNGEQNSSPQAKSRCQEKQPLIAVLVQLIVNQ